MYKYIFFGIVLFFAIIENIIDKSKFTSLTFQVITIVSTIISISVLWIIFLARIESQRRD